MPRRLGHVWQMERDTLKFRLLALLIIAFVLSLREETANLAFATSLIAGYMVYSALLHSVVMPRVFGPLEQQQESSLPSWKQWLAPSVLYTMLVIDLTTALNALYLFGLDTVLIVLVPLVIAYYALYMGYWGTIPAAVLGTFGYLGVAKTLEDQVDDLVAVQVPLFFMLALLTGYLAQQRFQEREQLLVLRRLVETEMKTKGLVEAVKRLEQGLELEGVARDLVSLSLKATGFPLCAIQTPNEDARGLVVRASNFLGTEGQDTSPSTPRKGQQYMESLSGGGPGATAFLEKRLLVITDAALLPPWLLENLAPATVVACPIVRGNQVLGVIYLADQQSRTVAPEEQSRIEGFAESAGRALEGALLYNETRSRSARLLKDIEEAVESLGRFRQVQERPVLRIGPLSLEPQRRRAIVDGAELALATAEFDVLYVLAENTGTPVDEATLLREAWGKDFVPQGNVVNVTIHRLRKKLEGTSLGTQAIKTVRGKGFMLVRSPAAGTGQMERRP